MSSSASPSAPNTNPFYVCFIEGNIRKCQGCKSFLGGSDGSVPAPPFDLCIARAERRSYRDATGVLRTPQKEQPAHYHLNLACVRAAPPDFVPASLLVPYNILPTLSTIHRDYLWPETEHSSPYSNPRRFISSSKSIPMDSGASEAKKDIQHEYYYGSVCSNIT